MAMLIGLINQLATKRGFIGLLIIYLVVFGTIVFILRQLVELTGFGILDFDRGYSFARVHQVLGSYGAEGMALYFRIQLLDLLNPALYSLLAAALTAMVWRGTGPSWLVLFPLLAGLGDYLENITLLMITFRYPDISEGLVTTSSTLSLLKNGLLVVGLIPLIVGIALRVTGRMRRG